MNSKTRIPCLMLTGIAQFLVMACAHAPISLTVVPHEYAFLLSSHDPIEFFQSDRTSSLVRGAYKLSHHQEDATADLEFEESSQLSLNLFTLFDSKSTVSANLGLNLGMHDRIKIKANSCAHIVSTSGPFPEGFQQIGPSDFWIVDEVYSPKTLRFEGSTSGEANGNLAATVGPALHVQASADLANSGSFTASTNGQCSIISLGHYYEFASESKTISITGPQLETWVTIPGGGQIHVTPIHKTEEGYPRVQIQFETIHGPDWIEAVAHPNHYVCGVIGKDRFIEVFLEKCDYDQINQTNPPVEVVRLQCQVIVFSNRPISAF